MKVTLTILEGQFTIHRLLPNHELPQAVFQSSFYSISKSNEELTIVCSSIVPIPSQRSETGWSCIKVLGPLDFSLTGILAGISAVVAKAGISLFAISTFDTDYILTKSKKLPAAKKALQEAGYNFA